MPTPPTRARGLAASTALLLLLGACSGGASERRPAAPGASPSSAPSEPPESAPERSASTPAPPDAPLLVAAGDIACRPGLPVGPDQCQHEATAQLVESLDPDVVAPLGDLQYERGEAANFARAYLPAWGRFLDRTRPAPGNHEYAGGRAPGYFAAFGGMADGVDGRGWYAYDLGAWRVIVLNSVCTVVGGCGPGSDQLAWLQGELAAHPDRCTLAYWHHPRWSSGLHGSDDGYQPFWDALTAAGADVVLGGHDHHYERFAPRQGLRQFVVGTGGRNLYPVLGRAPGSEVADDRTFGVLALTLRGGGYDWRFHAIPGSASGFSDAGSATC